MNQSKRQEQNKTQKITIQKRNKAMENKMAEWKLQENKGLKI